MAAPLLAAADLPPVHAASVPASEIVIGTHADLSGPLAAWGASLRNGISMAIAEVNLAGGIDGRTLRLVARDDRHDDAAAANAVRQLAEFDHAYAVLSPLGTPNPSAAIDEAAGHGLLYLFPMTASKEAQLPLAPLKFALTPPPSMGVQEGLRRLLNARTDARVGLIAGEDRLGRGIEEGVEKELNRRGMAKAVRGRFQANAKNLEDILADIKAQGVDLLVVGTDSFDAIKVLHAVSVLRWKPAMLCSMACYLPEFATLAGPEAEGLYSVGQVPMPYPDDPKLGPWAKKYEETFSAVATVHALSAYRAARLFLTVLKQAGPNATPEEFARMLETRGAWTDPELGGLPAEFSRTDHLGSHSGLLTQIRRGRWIVVSDPSLTPGAQSRLRAGTK